ncbi:uncharacterized protein [Antedon mediterranea]|uniref:uncharacterized protein n=1 Tax=Antedon mediterranea TaxID=105859 RepID=UPI003AF7516B
MSTIIGRLDPYDGEAEDWASYVERLEAYFMANGVDDDKRVPTLLSLIGPKTYGLLKNLVVPDLPSTKTFPELVDSLERHLSPKPLVIAERFRFHKREQHEGETIQAYLADLRRLTKHCEFGAQLNDALRDRLVCGIRSGSIQKRLLAEAKLTLAKALQMAVAMETATKDASLLQQQFKEEPQSTVNKINVKHNNKQQLCYRYNKGGHKANDCRYKEVECHTVTVKRRDISRLHAGVNQNKHHTKLRRVSE